jgi:hypothetical protein
MKHFKKQNTQTKIALFAGAAALMALTPKLEAQSSVDALLNKLEQKGILSVDEARELKAENQMDVTNDLAKAFNAKYPMSDWVNSLKFSGDFRGRFDDVTMDSHTFTDRMRWRYRVRLGLTVNMKDNLELGFRVGSGDPAPGTGFGGNPLSNNSTLQDNGTKKFLYVDAAYGKWTAINDGTWTLATIIGKMDNPFQLSSMVFDPDLTLEGAALQSGYKINDNQALVLNGGAFMLDELKTSSHDPFLAGLQVAWNAKWGSKVESSLGVATFNVLNTESLAATSAGANSGVPYVNQGNSRTAAGNLIENFNPVIADASITYKFDSCPLYPGIFPVKLAGEFMNNPAAPDQNNGIWVGFTLGKAGKKHAWDISYRYEYLENNAWYDALVDDDNGALYTVAPTGGGTGFFGGTNVKGHLVKLNYSITDGLTFTFTAYANELIHTAPNAPSKALHVMADLMWKF